MLNVNLNSYSTCSQERFSVPTIPARTLPNGLLDVDYKEEDNDEVCDKLLRFHDLRLKFKENENTTLLCLPAELRNEIWGYVLGGNTLKFYEPISLHNDFVRHSKLMLYPGQKNMLSLLQVCRQIYAGACPMPYTLNTFRFDC